MQSEALQLSSFFQKKEEDPVIRGGRVGPHCRDCAFFPLKKRFCLIHVVSLFFFSRVPKIFGGTSGFLGKSAHSELASFALCWLVVTFPCGIVHTLVMIRFRVEKRGRRVGQVLPSHQNRQISALDETADAPHSSLFSLLSSLFSLLSSLALSLFLSFSLSARLASLVECVGLVGCRVTVFCGLGVASYPQPPDPSQHGCTVGIDRDPPV